MATTASVPGEQDDVVVLDELPSTADATPFF
jgi:hypothetical protein